MTPSLPSQDQVERAHPVELHTSPLADLWLEVRRLAEAEDAPDDTRNEDLAAAVAAMRALSASLGGAVGFGLVEGNLGGIEDAEELARVFEDLPERWRSRDGKELELRAPAVAAAAAIAVLEPGWRASEWPAREKALAAKQAELERALDRTGGALYARLHRTLGLQTKGVVIPVYLVTAAPWPGAFTHRSHDGGAVSFVAIEDELPDLVEAIVHETIHALDIATPGPESLLVELRQRLAAAGMPARATHDWAHTLFFLEAGAAVRDLLDPAHVDYGDRTTLYARSRPAADVERPLWKEYAAGERTRDELLQAIVDAATRKRED